MMDRTGVPVGGLAPTALVGVQVHIVRVRAGVDQVSGANPVHIGVTVLAGAIIPVIIQTFMVRATAGAPVAADKQSLLTA